MKICQVCAVDFTLYRFLLPLMEALRDEGHEVVGACADGALAERVRARGFRVEPVAFTRNRDVVSHARAYRRLVRLFRREHFDLVHVHTPVAALIGRLAAARTGVGAIVYTAHGFYFHEGMHPLVRAFHVGLEWLGGRFTDVLFTQAEEDARTARRYRLCRGNRIEAIGNGADPAVFHPCTGVADRAERARLRAALGASDTSVVALTVGRLVIEKGYAELFAAIAGLDLDLWVVGERLASDHAGAIEDLLAALAADPARRARVHLLGARDDVDALMRAADLFVLASHREGMPRTIVEAMLSGLAVVATDVRGAREEVVEGATGLLVPTHDAGALAAGLRRLGADADLRARLGAAGHERARSLHDEAAVIRRQIAALGLGRGD